MYTAYNVCRYTLAKNVKQHPTLSQTPDKTWKDICNDGKNEHTSKLEDGCPDQ